MTAKSGSVWWAMLLFGNTSNQSLLTRMIRVTLIDGDGGTSVPVTKLVNAMA